MQHTKKLGPKARFEKPSYQNFRARLPKFVVFGVWTVLRIFQDGGLKETLDIRGKSHRFVQNLELLLSYARSSFL